MKPVHQHQINNHYDSREVELRLDGPETYEEARATLSQLRQREEIVRNRANQLEGLSEDQKRFQDEQSRMIASLEDLLEIVDRENVNARNLADRCLTTQQSLLHHLNAVQSLQVHGSSNRELQAELNYAFDQIDEAAESLETSRGLMSQINKPISQTGRTQINALPNFDFLFCLKAGLAFLLPLMTLIVAISIMLYFLK